MIENDRLIAPESRIEDQGQDWAIQPKTLSEYVGQPAVVEQMGLFMDAARAGSPLVAADLRTAWAQKNYIGKSCCCRNVC